MRTEPTAEEIFHEARARSRGPEREAYVQTACAGDPELRVEVATLLQADDRAADADFLESKVGAVGGPSVGSKRGQVDAFGRLGRFRVVRELGRGAQAIVYLAVDEELDRQVALKVLTASFGEPSEDALRRFRREATATASFEHPGICSVYEAGYTDGVAWIAMQHVGGETLAERLEQVDADVGEPLLGVDVDAGDATMRVVSFIERAARALHVAHERGLVHRDVKPGNLMVTAGDEPVVLDFGIAQVSDSGAGLTRTTDVLGTPRYMAPEQLRGASVELDRRVDVYALGVTLYECLALRPPFAASSREQLYRQILEDEPLPVGGIPRDLEIVIAAALRKGCDHRYSSALEFADDLRRVRLREPIHARRSSALDRTVLWVRRHPALAASLALTLVSLGIALGFTRASLGEAREALRAAEAAEFAKYDQLSRQAAVDDVRGRDGWALAGLRRESSRRIDAATRAGEMRPSRRLAAAWNRYKRSVPLSGEFAEDYAALVRELRESGDLRFRRALADRVHADLRDMLLILGVGRDRTESLRVARAAVELARFAVEDSDHLLPADARRVMARVLLLDALHRAEQFGEVASTAEGWIREEGADRTYRRALYESRLGRSMVGLARVDPERSVGFGQRALELLRGSVPSVHEQYPFTWFANLAWTSTVEAGVLLELPDETRRAREILRDSLARSPDLTRRIHSSLTAYRAAMEPPLRAVWERANAFIRDRMRAPDLMESVDRLLAGIDRDAAALGVGDGDKFWALLATGYSVMAMRTPNGHPARARILEHAVACLERSGPLREIHHSRSATILRYLAQHREHLGDLVGAESAARRGLALCPPSSRKGESLTVLLGRIQALRGEYDEARRRLGHATDLARGYFDGFLPRHRETFDALILLGRLSGDLDLAVEGHEERLAVQETPEERRRLGLTHLLFGNFERARKMLEPIAAGDVVADRHLARLALLEGDVDRAIDRARSLVDRDPLAHRVLAQALLARGGVEAALGHFELGARELEPPNGDGFFSDHGLALVAAGQLEAGKTLLRDLTDGRPGDPEAWAERSRFLTFAEGLSGEDQRQAVECAERACELCGRGRAHVLALLAEALLRSGDREAAESAAGDLLLRMRGRDAMWLSLDRAQQLLRRCRRD